jgi:D-tyrosyl-tRNA(Tyr) deacylase
MRVCLQRVLEAYVEVDNKKISEIDKGILLFVGFGKDDNSDSLNAIVNKIIRLRIFPNDLGKFDKSIEDVNGEILVVSQFTLFGNVNKGNRPDFTSSMPFVAAETFYNRFIDALSEFYYKDRVKTGVFGAKMVVGLKNDGPVTLIIEYP